MLIKLYTYILNYKDEKLELTKQSSLFKKYAAIYNETIHKLIEFLNKIKYNNSLNKSLNPPQIQFHEECIYY